MSLTITIAGASQATIPVKSLVLATTAFRAEKGTGSGLNLDDDAGAISIPARAVVLVTENATTSPTRLFRGRVPTKDLARGQMPQGDAKQFDIALDDVNADLEGIIVDGWVRPAETDVARITALLTTFLQGSPRVSTDLTSLISTDEPVNLGAETYDDTNPAAVITAILEETNKEAFVTVDEELYYAPRGDTSYAAGLAIADDETDDNETIFAPVEASGTEDGIELLSGVKLKYGDGQSVTVSRPAVVAAHDHWETTLYDGAARAANAEARANALLDRQGEEELRYKCAIYLRADQVDLVKAGQTLPFQAAAAGVLEPITTRVSRLSWSLANEVDVYRADLELGAVQPREPRIKKVGGPTGVFVPGPLHWYFGVLTGVTDAPCLASGGCGTLVSDNTAGAYFEGGKSYNYAFGFIINAGDTARRFAIGASLPSCSSTKPTATVLEVTNVLGQTGSFSIPPGPANNGVRHAFGAVEDQHHDGGTFNLTWWVDPVGWTPPRPKPGQEVYPDRDAVADGITTTFSTRFPYLPGSLKVTVDGIPILKGLSETDPTTGAFTLDFAPEPSESIVSGYRAA